MLDFEATDNKHVANCAHCNSPIKPGQKHVVRGRARGYFKPSRFCSVECMENYEVRRVAHSEQEEDEDDI